MAAVKGDLFGVGDQTGVNVPKVALPIGFLGNLKENNSFLSYFLLFEGTAIILSGNLLLLYRKIEPWKILFQI